MWSEAPRMQIKAGDAPSLSARPSCRAPPHRGPHPREEPVDSPAAGGLGGIPPRRADPVHRPIPATRSLPNAWAAVACNGRGMAQRHIKKGAHAIKRTRLACVCTSRPTRRGARSSRRRMFCALGDRGLVADFATPSAGSPKLRRRGRRRDPLDRVACPSRPFADERGQRRIIGTWRRRRGRVRPDRADIMDGCGAARAAGTLRGPGPMQRARGANADRRDLRAIRGRSHGAARRMAHRRPRPESAWGAPISAHSL